MTKKRTFFADDSALSVTFVYIAIDTISAHFEWKPATLHAAAALEPQCTSDTTPASVAGANEQTPLPLIRRGSFHTQ